MNILWLVNIILPKLAQRLGVPVVHTGGWLSAQLDQLERTDCSVTVCCVSDQTKRVSKETIDGVSYVVYPRENDEGLVEIFSELLKGLNPDLVHVHGTEFYHSYAMLQAAREYRSIVSIQGLVSVYAKHYYADLPNQFQQPSPIKKALAKLLKVELIQDGKHVYEQNGEWERKTLLLARHVIGRTEWDKACTTQINSELVYHHCGEILRKPFYEEPKWAYRNCERHSLFISQGYYPIKGFHKLLLILPKLINQYPDLKVYVAGTQPTKNDSAWKEVILNYILEYDGYVKKLIAGTMERHIEFTGALTAEQMRERLLKANVFVLPSSIENSPNSLGEAMLVGTPIVASDVGGVCDMLTHRTDGYLYPFDEEYMLLYYIDKLFQSGAAVEVMSRNSIYHAQRNHSPQENTKQLLNIYQEIIQA